ncbi:capsular biosynthesis protein [Fusobacterium necrophorum]|nr:capsular biosynthesis protein [Fusobacterium necrophorum]AZW08951.1 capsular biosynthesis protein [Fusobacterium necrophorum subsp. necrophorum]SDB39924.1 Capsular polysaccharide synthesis protein [Fusobacterium necrophorum]SQD09936.1 Mannosyltransferase OCH1 and related enzymes [Fusobacterium necrophorum subsp. necrophorum]
MKWKQLLRKIFPKKIYFFLRTTWDFTMQNKVSKELDKLLALYFDGKLEVFSFTPKKKLENKKIIWQFWGQGWEYEKLPDIVKLCYKSVEKYKGEYEVIRLDEHSIQEYLDFPEFVFERLRKKQIPYANFADLLRVALLDLYGGVSLDPTVILTGRLENKIGEKGYFSFQRSEEAEHKNIWKNFDCSYFSWDRRNKVKLLSSIMYAEQGNIVIHTMLQLTLHYWKKKKSIDYYFFFQVLYTEIIEKYLTKEQCIVEDDTVPHELAKDLFKEYSEERLSKIISRNFLHKLNHKVSPDLLKKENTIYQYLIKLYQV